MLVVTAGREIANTAICWPDNVMLVCPPQDVFCARAAPHGENISTTFGLGHLEQLGVIEARLHSRVVYKICPNPGFCFLRV